MNSQIQTTTPVSIPLETAGSKPYPPSLIDRFMDAVERLPIPYGLTYLALFVLEGILNHVVSWADGWLPVYTFSPLMLLFPLWQWGPFVIMTSLNAFSRKALSQFRPLLDIPPESIQRLEYEFTTMPYKNVILSGIIWAIWYVVIGYLWLSAFHASFRFGTTVTVFLILEGFIAFSAGSVIYYHTIRQLGLVYKTVNTVKHFNLFRLEPVYAFSAVTSRTGLAWAILLALTLLMFPIQIALVPTLILLIIQIMLAMAAFVLPLRIVNQRLVAEKRRLLVDHDQRVEAALGQLHRCLDDDELGQVVQLSSAITGLKAEHEILAKIPTWPWSAEMLTGFLSIVALPMIIFLIQFALGRWLGK